MKGVGGTTAFKSIVLPFTTVPKAWVTSSFCDPSLPLLRVNLCLSTLLTTRLDLSLTDSFNEKTYFKKKLKLGPLTPLLIEKVFGSGCVNLGTDKEGTQCVRKGAEVRSGRRRKSRRLGDTSETFLPSLVTFCDFITRPPDPNDRTTEEFQYNIVQTIL